jgi:hypothetical protein
MSALSDYTEELLLDHLLTQGPFYIALYTSSPGDTNTGTEATGASYARQAITFTRTASDLSNSGAVNFPTATESWGNITHVGIFDAVTGGNLMWHDQLTSSKLIETGDTASFPLGASILNLD